jgi:acetyltransferase-like isoleucine patch superfamily enzyme
MRNFVMNTVMAGSGDSPDAALHSSGNPDLRVQLVAAAAGDTRRTSSSQLRAAFVRFLVAVYLGVIAGVPAVTVGLLLSLSPSGVVRPLLWVATIPVGALTFAFTCALLSWPTRGAIVAGRFPRDLGHAVYGPRRLYALCWTSLCYCGPIYHAVLAIPFLKWAIFRLFGYRGSLNVQIYPDTWIRDLPLLDIEDGAYLSNKATIGTNMCLASGDVLVERIRIGSGAMVGHLVMLGPGCRIAENAEIGVGAAVGSHVLIGRQARVGGRSMIHHGARIGAGAQIGVGAYVGVRVTIGDGVIIPPGVVIPDRARIRTQDELAQYVGPVSGQAHTTRPQS